MRHHAKASSAGPTMRQANGLGRIVRGVPATREDSRRAEGSGAPAGRRLALAVFAALLALLVLVVAPAGATKTHFLIEDFGSAAQPSFSEPRSLAIDQSSGDVLVLNENTISRYHPDGTPDNFSALGSNVIDGEGAGDETPDVGLGAGPELEGQIAVDNSGGATDGNIYVTEPGRQKIYVFASSGAYLGALHEYKEGADATGPLAVLGRPCGVAVAPNGTVYVGDNVGPNGQIHKYVPSANPPVDADNVANFSYAFACNLAAGAGPTAGYLFAATSSGELSKLDASTGEVKYHLAGNVFGVAVDPATGEVYAATGQGGFLPGGGATVAGFYHFDASGDSGATTIAAIQGIKESAEGSGRAIAVRGSNGHLYLAMANHPYLRVYGPFQTAADLEIRPATEVSATKATLHGSVNPDGAAVTECKFEYGTVESGTFTGSVPCEESVPTDANAHVVSAGLTGLSPGVDYHFRLVVTNTDRTSTSGEQTFRTPPRVFTGGPTGVSTQAATLNGLVRPEAEQVTDCTFEYGRSAAYGASAPCSPAAASIPADYSTQAVSAGLTGLEESTVYHYRLTFTTAGGTFTGKDELFRTRAPSGLPDNRRYEQVSPTEKNGGDIYAAATVASVDGNRLVMRSNGTFAGAPTSLLGGVQYLVTRGPSGWSTKDIYLPGGAFAFLGYELLTRDLSGGVLKWYDKSQIGPHDPDAQPGFNLYTHDFASPTFTLVNGTLSELGYQQGRGFAVWGSSDLSHLAIVSHAALTPEAEAAGCENASFNVECAYEWDDGVLRLASVVNDQPVQGAPGTRPGDNGCGYQHAMSDDGSRLFFTSPTMPSQGTQQLYARENGTSTTPISESERTLPGGLGGQGINFQSAESAHGSRVLFSTKNTLLDADTDETNDLYLYDYTKPAGERLTLVSADHNPNAPEGANVNGGLGFECGGMMGASEDLRRVYFVADSQIVAGEPEAAGPKLYLWDDTGANPTTTYVGTLSAAYGESRAWSGALVQNVANTRDARISEDGRFVAFLSSAQLTDFDNEGRQEVYRYDAVSESLECASCSADATSINGPVGFEAREGFAGGGGFAQFVTTYNHVTSSVSESGQVFFNTKRGLLPADSNGKSDVYEYEDGQLRLISSGEGPDDSFLLDATPSGSDVFFTTKDRLVGWDRDDNVDAYDARVNGGFPEPPLVPASCQGDACQAAPVAPNDATPGSSSFQGAGNVSEPRARRCAKGKVRSKGKCRKRKPSKKQSARHQQQSKPATRSHG